MSNIYLNKFLSIMRQKYGSEMSYNSITRTTKQIVITNIWDNKILAGLLISKDFKKIFIPYKKDIHLIYSNFNYDKITIITEELSKWFKTTFLEGETSQSVVLYNYKENDNFLNELLSNSLPILIIRRKKDVVIENFIKFYLQETCSDVEKDYDYDILTQIPNQMIEENLHINFDKMELDESTNDYESPSIQSENQFNYIIRLRDNWNKNFNNILYMKCKEYEKKNRLYETIRNCVKDEDKSHHCDSYIYKKLAKTYWDLVGIKESQNSIYRSEKRVDDIYDLLNLRDFNWGIKNMLDIGCAEGNITYLIGQLINLDKDNIFGCDIRDVPSEDKEKFTFKMIKEDNKLPFEDGSIDLVFSFMSFHHYEDPVSMINEIYRILSPNGCLIIREHDAFQKPCKALLDFLHGMYSMVWSNPPEQPNFCREFHTYYKNREEWDNFFKEYNFNRISNINTSCNKLYNAGRRRNSYFYEYYAMYAKDTDLFLKRAISEKEGAYIYNYERGNTKLNYDDDEEEEEVDIDENNDDIEHENKRFKANNENKKIKYSDSEEENEEKEVK